MLVCLRSVSVLRRFEVRLEFTDATESTVDLEPYLLGPDFETFRRDPTRFATVGIDPHFGTIVGPDGEDIAPEVLYETSALA
jgi:hypothetical protein